MSSREFSLNSLGCHDAASFIPGVCMDSDDRNDISSSGFWTARNVEDRQNRWVPLDSINWCWDPSGSTFLCAFRSPVCCQVASPEFLRCTASEGGNKIFIFISHFHSVHTGRSNSPHHVVTAASGIQGCTEKQFYCDAAQGPHIYSLVEGEPQHDLWRPERDQTNSISTELTTDKDYLQGKLINVST